jgi:hypothetical protein
MFTEVLAFLTIMAIGAPKYCKTFEWIARAGKAWRGEDV